MTYYRIHPLDLSTRMTLAIEMLLPIPERPWGHVTHLASQIGVSRQWLYELRDQASLALCEALRPRQPGPQHQAETLIIDQPFVQRAITIFPLLRGTVRGIQEGLDLLFGVHRSVGHISETLQQAGSVASDLNAAVSIPLPVLAEADEIFQGKQPCLTVVDGRSFVVLNHKAATTRDATTWGVTFLDLQKQGIQFHDLVSDGARGITSGVKEAQLAIPLRLSFFHLLREAQKISQRLERNAYRAIEIAERARRACAEAQAPSRRRGRPLSIRTTRQKAEADEQVAVETYDLFLWLVGEVRCALEPITPSGRLTTEAFALATVQTAAALMDELPDKKVKGFAQRLLQHVYELVAPLCWVETYLQPFRTGIDEATERLIIWAWQHQEFLTLSAGEGFPEALQPVVHAFFQALSLFHRTSSLAECLHSFVRPYLQMHRGMPKWLLPLLQLYWNHREFQRGERAGESPLSRAGVKDAPSLKEVIQRLVHSAPISQAP